MKNYIFNSFRNFVNPLVSIFALIDNKTKIDKKAKINRFVKLNNVTLDAYSYVGPRTRINNATVGKFCSISWDCDIGLPSHNMQVVSTSPIFSHIKNGTGSMWVESNIDLHDRGVTIGSDVWIGSKVIILDGVNIGHGAVIGAGAIVTKDVPPYAIVAGVPAKIISYRFSSEIITALLDKCWWDCPAEIIKSKLTIFRLAKLTLSDIDSLPHA